MSFETITLNPRRSQNLSRDNPARRSVGRTLYYISAFQFECSQFGSIRENDGLIFVAVLRDLNYVHTFVRAELCRSLLYGRVQCTLSFPENVHWLFFTKECGFSRVKHIEPSPIWTGKSQTLSTRHHLQTPRCNMYTFTCLWYIYAKGARTFYETLENGAFLRHKSDDR